MHAINTREKDIGIASGILQDAEIFAPVICDAPRLIHDSRVYPKLCGVRITVKPKKGMRILRHKQTVKHDMLSTIGSRATLGLPNRNGSAEETNPEPNDGTSSNKLGESKR